MPKAIVTTKSGATVAIEGSEDEVAALLARIEAGENSSNPSRRGASRKSDGKPTMSGLVAELIEEGFFKTPKELGAVKVALEQRGHFYPVTSLSPLMVRLVRKKGLRRLKEKKRWMYVG